MDGTPSRRSRRHQPFVPTPSKATAKTSKAAALVDVDQISLGEPISSRGTRLPDDVSITDELVVNEEGDDEDSGKNLTTTFYAGFIRHGSRRQKGKGKVTEDEEFRVGDAVLVRGFFKEDTQIAVIIATWSVITNQEDGSDESDPQDQERHLVLVHWFIQRKRLPKTAAEREHRDSEIYYTLNQTAVLPTSSILSRCEVYPPATFPVKEKVKGWIYETDDFLCDAAFEDGTYYDFDWEKHKDLASDASLRNPDMARELWLVRIDKVSAKRAIGTKSKRKRGNSPDSVDSDAAGGSHDGNPSDQFVADSDEGDEPSPSDSDGGSEEDDSSRAATEDAEEGAPPGTRKRRKVVPSRKSREGATSPRKSSTRQKGKGKAKAVSTPSSKRAISQRRQGRGGRKGGRGRPRISKPSMVGVDDEREALMALPPDPHVRAMHMLHVASRPTGAALPGRDGEFDEVLGSILSVLEEGSGGCIYISGVPGTGKTATVHAVVRELQKMAMNNETNPFTYVEINGLRLPEPSAAYALLWEAVAGHDVQKEGHLKVSSKEALKRLDRYFGGGGAGMGPAGGAFVVLMDELDQLVTAKQDVVYNFFNWPNLPNSRLVVIAVSNTHDLPERVMTAKVKSRLGMERIQFHPYTREQLIEIVHSRLRVAKESLDIPDPPEVMHEDAIKFASARVAAVNGDARRVLDISRRSVETVYQPGGQSGTVRMAEVTAVIKAMQNSPNAAFVRECSFVERLVLAALIKCGKREGVSELKWGDVTQQCMILFEQLRDDQDNSLSRPNVDRLRFVLNSLVSSKAAIVEIGAAAEKKLEHERLVMMNMETNEVVRALSDAGGSRWENVLGT